MANKKLLKEVYEKLLEISLVDIHTHLNPLSLKSSSIADIILYHYIATELVTSGMPRKILEIVDPKESVIQTIPFLKNVRNTSTFWALRKILSEVFEFKEELTEDSFPTLLENFEAFKKNLNGISFLKEKVKAKKVFLTMQYNDSALNFDTSFFTGSLRLEKLSRDISSEVLRDLEKVTSIEIKNSRSFKEGISTLLEKFKGKISALAISLNPSEQIMSLEESKVSEALSKVMEKRQLSIEDKNSLISFVIEESLNFAKDNKITFQLMLGVERPVAGASPPDYAIVINEPKQLLYLCSLFNKYKEVNFDVISASRIQTHEIDVIAKNYPNVFSSGFWWYSYYPSIMEERTKEKIQMLPMNKWCAFFSDAYVPEWSYGKAQLTKYQLAITLGNLVEQGYFNKELAIEIAENLLYKNAIDIYHL